MDGLKVVATLPSGKELKVELSPLEGGAFGCDRLNVTLKFLGALIAQETGDLDAGIPVGALPGAPVPELAPGG